MKAYQQETVLDFFLDTFPPAELERMHVEAATEMAALGDQGHDVDWQTLFLLRVLSHVESDVNKLASEMEDWL